MSLGTFCQKLEVACHSKTIHNTFGTRNNHIQEGYPCYFDLKFVVENITVLDAYPTMSERTVHMGSAFLKT